MIRHFFGLGLDAATGRFCVVLEQFPKRQADKAEIDNPLISIKGEYFILIAIVLGRFRNGKGPGAIDGLLCERLRGLVEVATV